MISGTMGVGKSSVCAELNKQLPKSVYLDGDWCWNMDPFVVNKETKAMVIKNICFMLNSFLRCSELENVIFCWVMHIKEIQDEILSALDLSNVRVICVSLICSSQELEKRLMTDISGGRRETDIIEKSLSRLSLYNSLGNMLLDTTALTPQDTAAKIATLAGI